MQATETKPKQSEIKSICIACFGKLEGFPITPAYWRGDYCSVHDNPGCKQHARNQGAYLKCDLG